ncbi:MAG: ATP phosphoribosyltransferase [Candidatus Aquicultorales bacterium]
MLSIALPKGSLEEQTKLLFAQADLEIKAQSRGYNPRIEDPRIDKVKILRPQEIPKYVEEGYFDLGIAGHDWVLESGADVQEIAELPFAKTGAGVVKLVVAVHESTPIDKAEDIPANSRVSTEMPNVTKAYFEHLGIPVKIFYSYGATEAKIPELMDVVVDLTETGRTLVQNRLKIVGTILESTTRLLANKAAWDDPGKRQAMEEIRTLLLGVLEARGKVLVTMNVPKDKLDGVMSELPALKKPTVAHLYKSDFLAVETVVEKSTVNILIPKLKAAGAEDILEMAISKIVR